jgi:hypothetical protein
LLRHKEILTTSWTVWWSGIFLEILKALSQEIACILWNLKVHYRGMTSDLRSNECLSVCMRGRVASERVRLRISWIRRQKMWWSFISATYGTQCFCSGLWQSQIHCTVPYVGRGRYLTGRFENTGLPKRLYIRYMYVRRCTVTNIELLEYKVICGSTYKGFFIDLILPAAL